MWRKASKKIIEYDCIIKFLKETSQYEHEIILGTDSQPFNNGTFLVSAIAIICKNKKYHAKYFYKQYKDRPKHHSLYERIFYETETTIKLASEIKSKIPQANIIIHLDVSDERSATKTAKFSKSLVAMVRGYGYENVEIKPNSWCASKLADKYTKRVPFWMRTQKTL